jgi:hypothetical protein
MGDRARIMLEIAAAAESEIGRDVRASTRQEHRDSFKKTLDKPPMRVAIDRLMAPPYSPARLEQLFGGHATYGQIQNWRYGHCKPPPWAVDLICGMLEEHARTLLRVAAAITPGPGKGDPTGVQLARWRAAGNRAGRPKKEKAAARAALEQE